MTPIEDLRSAVEAAAAELRNGGPAPSSALTLERPKKAGFGDFSTNAAMLLAPALKAPPREIAEKLGAALQERLGAQVDHVEVAGPGFLNIFLADDWYTGAAAHVLAAGDGYGGGTADPPEKIQVEFVSANPTGPLTAASGRHAAYGDSLRRLFRFQGHEVEGEYYFNDTGAQIRKFGESIIARARAEEPPEGGYQGDYVTELARRIPGAEELDPDTVAAEGVSLIVERIRATLASYHVEFDNWFREASLHEGDPSPVQRALDDLPEGGHLPRRRRAVAADQGARRRQRGPRAGAPHGRADLLRVRRRLRGVQTRARVRPLLHRARLRPPRLHRAHEGRRGGARRGPGAARDPDAAVRAHRRARREGRRCPSAAATSSCSTS